MYILLSLFVFCVQAAPPLPLTVEVGNNTLPYREFSFGHNLTVDRSKRQSSYCGITQWQCSDGACIPAIYRCDGIANCRDGSDETAATCSDTGQSKVNQCIVPPYPKNGGFIVTNHDGATPGQTFEKLFLYVNCDQGYKLDVEHDSVICVNGTWRSPMPTCEESKPTKPETCEVPPHPEYGKYSVIDVPDAVPGQIFESLHLFVTCEPKYRALGPPSAYCLEGVWYSAQPKCIPDDFCKLQADPNIEYACPIARSNETRVCNAYQRPGAVVRVKCKSPKYISDNMQTIKCIQGKWDDTVPCVQDLLKNQLKTTTPRPQPPSACVLPPFPEHGTYTVRTVSNPIPGQIFDFVHLDVTCQPGYEVVGADHMSCSNGKWTGGSQPKCGPVKSGACVVPPNPNHGTYTVSDVPNAIPGQTLEYLHLNVSCPTGYGVVGPESVFCLNGKWYGSIPECKRFCKLDSHPSVHYHCIVSGPVEGTRICNAYEPPGTVVRPECIAPNYYSTYTLHSMRCNNGNWNQIVTCIPECGKVTPEGKELVVGGRRAKKGELPWHAGIYTKTTQPYLQICGGSLVTYTVVISAAHCFWSDIGKQLQATNFAVAVGKLYRPWNNNHDEDAQRSDVLEIHLPQRFQGGSTNFQDDIAIVVTATAFEYKTHVRPVCLNFDIKFERRQLQPGKLGKVAGWGLTEKNGVEAQVLQVVELPYVDVSQCYSASPAGFQEYITSDKICAGYTNGGTALCKGDSGGGLAFPAMDQSTERYYLRGIVSTAPNNDDLCNVNTLTTFTQILTHENFINTYL